MIEQRHKLRKLLPLKAITARVSEENDIVDYMGDSDVEQARALLSEIIEKGRLCPFKEAVNHEDF